MNKALLISNSKKQQLRKEFCAIDLYIVYVLKISGSGNGSLFLSVQFH